METYTKSCSEGEEAGEIKRRSTKRKTRNALKENGKTRRNHVEKKQRGEELKTYYEFRRSEKVRRKKYPKKE